MQQKRGHEQVVKETPLESFDGVSKKKVFLVTKKSFLTCNKKNYPDVSHQFATQLLYIQHESNQTIAKIGYMVKVFANTMRLPGSNPSHERTRKEKKKKENRRDLVCLKAL